MANSKRVDQFSRPCTSTQTQTNINQNRTTCTCYSKNRYDKPKELIARDGSATANFKPAKNIPKKTCTRCHSRKDKVAYDIEPYAESTTKFQETHNKSDSQGSSLSKPNPDSPDAKQSPKNENDLTPKEIMNTWIPAGRARPAERLFTPSEDYVDISPRDFSMRKYFPELFLSESEKTEIRAKERAEIEENQRRQEERKTSNHRQGSEQDWKKIVEESEIQAPNSSWREDTVALAKERKEVDEKSNSKAQMSPKRSSNWFKWSRGKLKQEKKKEYKNKDGNRSDDYTL